MRDDAYLIDVTRRFRELKQYGERAIRQVPEELWGVRIDPETNSIVTLLLHLSGNMISRWTDFLTTDGEKPGRDRDAEFEDPAGLPQEALLARWARGWDCLFDALAGLTAADLGRTVTIRGQPQTVLEAINRQLMHYASHTGQIVFLSKHLAGARWQTLSIPRRGSAAFHESTKEKK